MRKLFIFILLGASFILSAQTPNGTSTGNGIFDFNIKAGLSLSNPKYKQDHSQRTSFYAGISGELAVSNEASLTLGAEYIETGVTDHEGTLNTINVSQLNIPLTVKVYPLDLIYLEAGAYAGFILSAEGELDSANIDLNEFEDMDYGALFGLGFEFDSLFIEARYNLGLKYLIESEAFDPDLDPVAEGSLTNKDYKSRFFQIGIGYKF
jgi:hypothetical protein